MNKISFPLQPFSGHFPLTKDEEIYVLSTGISTKGYLGLLELTKKFDINVISSSDKFITNFEPDSHLHKFASVVRNHLISTTSALGVSFKDSSLLQILSTLIPDLNCEYLNHQSDLKIERSESIALLQSMLSPELIGANRKLSAKYGLVVARHIIEHVYSLSKFFSFVDGILCDDGFLIIEIPDSTKLFKSGNPSVFWEEHTYYLDDNSLVYLLECYGYECIVVARYEYSAEDSVAILATKTGRKRKTHLSVKDISPTLNESFHMYPNSNKSFCDKIRLSRMYDKFAIFGAGHSAISIIANDTSLMPVYAIDDNPYKVGRFLPRVKSEHVPIISLDQLVDCNDYLDILLSINPSSYEKVINNLSLKLPGDKINIILPA